MIVSMVYETTEITDYENHKIPQLIILQLARHNEEVKLLIFASVENSDDYLKSWPVCWEYKTHKSV